MFGLMTAAQSPTTAEELRGAGLRVTAARVALLETVRDAVMSETYLHKDE